MLEQVASPVVPLWQKKTPEPVMVVPALLMVSSGPSTRGGMPMGRLAAVVTPLGSRALLSVGPGLAHWYACCLMPLLWEPMVMTGYAALAGSTARPLTSFWSRGVSVQPGLL